LELESSKIPQRCVVLEELPLTAKGKVDRNGLAIIADERSL
jgi:non-ribosomal peptide synthetase component E (peptide arylation enzyme)